MAEKNQKELAAELIAILDRAFDFMSVTPAALEARTQAVLALIEYVEEQRGEAVAEVFAEAVAEAVAQAERNKNG